jgi:hypothetical protein
VPKKLAAILVNLILLSPEIALKSGNNITTQAKILPRWFLKFVFILLDRGDFVFLNFSSLSAIANIISWINLQLI